YIDISCSFFTFDPSDAKENNIGFLPLFYVKEYDGLDVKPIMYDFSFVGTAHSERFRSVSNITKGSDAKFLFFYCPSYMVFLFKKYLKGELQGLKLSDVSFSSMSRTEVVSLVEKTNTIIDICHPDQIGLTMRTIEMLGAEKKIITTNSQVLSYDFYHPNNILYVDGKTSPETINEFVDVPYSPLECELRNKYSINSWIESLFL
ncbi:lipopolysaccharide biosynthesis protein, partial [Vibrio splendidus]